MALQKLACAELQVEHLTAAVEFNAEVFGLSEIGRDEGRVFMALEADHSAPQLILREGGTGVTRFTLSVDSEEDLSTYSARLEQLGVSVSKRTDTAPNRHLAVAFTLPTGQEVELVPDSERPIYPHQALDRPTTPRGVAPLDIDHITIAFPDPAAGRATAELLTDGLGFGISDVILDAEGEWLAAWTRAGELHHDVGLIRCQPGASLHHLAWTLRGAEHFTVAADVLANAGQQLETGPGRHGVGGNLYAYFWAPGGNRYELSAEMPRIVGARKEPLVRSVTTFNSFSAWGIPRPESFTRGS
jgi:catechol 2,3-dioxygenase